MTTALHYLNEWTNKDPWKIHVLNKLTSKCEINSNQLLEEVLQLIQSENKLELVGEITFEPIEEEVLILEEVRTPKNINALSSDVQFSLGKNLNVLYGENGSGKSSYARMFRKLADNYFSSTKHLAIFPNVYDEKAIKDSLLQTVNITYTLGNQKKTEIVDINQQHSVLRKINVFDSDSVLPLTNNDLSFSILPKGFELFGLFSNMLDTFRSELSAIIKSKKVKQDKIFIDSSYDVVRVDLDKIFSEVKNHKDIKIYLDNNYPRSDSFEDVIEEIELQISELESSNPKDKIKILSLQKTKLEELEITIRKLAVALSKENIEKINKLISDYEEKILEEREYNESVKQKATFLDIVNHEWLSFVNAGKVYYDSINKDHVMIGEPCIFCSQPIDSSNLNLVESYIQNVASNKRDAHNSIEKDIVSHNIGSIVISLAEEEAAALFESGKLLEGIKSVIKLVNRNKELFSSLLDAKKLITDQVILDVTDIIQEINQEILVLRDRIDNLKNRHEEFTEIIASRKVVKETMQKNEKLHVSLESLVEWYQIRESIENYIKANSKFFTHTLTQKQGEAFKKIVQGEYFETFDQFANQLKVSNVNLKLIPQKGKTLRKKFVTSEEYKVSQIMSEGEQKAVAMVEFATDLTMRKNFNTVIFDDPVTSLDYKRSELFADLIYQLSLDRQVVVFTHNIMLYYYLYNASAKIKNKENKFFKVDEFDKLNKGIVSESFSGRLENLKEVMKKLKAQEQNLNSKTCFGDELEETLKKTYADIRTWCELIVEEGFFNSVIRRHEPNIMFTKVKDIKGEFIGELDSVSSLFEKSCRWMVGHSQSKETQHTRASIEAFNEDMKYIHQLYSQFK